MKKWCWILSRIPRIDDGQQCIHNRCHNWLYQYFQSEWKLVHWELVTVPKAPSVTPSCFCNKISHRCASACFTLSPCWFQTTDSLSIGLSRVLGAPMLLFLELSRPLCQNCRIRWLMKLRWLSSLFKFFCLSIISCLRKSVPPFITAFELVVEVWSSEMPSSVMHWWNFRALSRW